MYMQSLSVWGEVQYRASKSGCLGRCTEGPVCVIYPEGTWYTYIDEADIKEIIDESILKDNVIKRLCV